MTLDGARATLLAQRLVIALERIADELERARYAREIDREVDRARFCAGLRNQYED